ncbi:LysM peptidoglycan-binding domain-containing protein [Streptomyces sp. NPDC058155]|uniref:LysM peptidoglycan-binding domain-containing protein n=1 Tax=Streptomyces sp. NPDC058155 TaxID=3346359 RepID=UPI0036E7EDEF
MFGITVEQLVKWNRIKDPDLIHPDQRLIVAKSVRQRHDRALSPFEPRGHREAQRVKFYAAGVSVSRLRFPACLLGPPTELSTDWP